MITQRCLDYRYVEQFVHFDMPMQETQILRNRLERHDMSLRLHKMREQESVNAHMGANIIGHPAGANDLSHLQLGLSFIGAQPCAMIGRAHGPTASAARSLQDGHNERW